MDQEAGNVDVVSEFGLNPTLKNFERLDPSDRIQALADHLVYQESNSSSETDLILKRFIKDTPSALGELYQSTFQSAMEDRKPDVAHRYFQLGVAGNPQKAQKYICEAFHRLAFYKAAGDDEINLEDALPPHSLQIEILIPLIAGVPNLQSAECDIYPRKNSKVSIAKLFAITSSELAVKLSKQIRAESMASAAVTQSFARCSLKDIAFLADRAITSSNNAELKVGKEVYFSEQIGNCFLNGMIVKQSGGFEYAPQNQNGGYPEKRIFFSTGAELAGKIKGQFKQ